MSSDFYLLDTYGAFRCLAMHPYLEVVAYDTGCMVIVWNVKTDAKTSLLKHEYEVVLIQFLFNEALDMNQDQFLLTIDASGVGCVWDLDDGLCIHEFRFSNRARLAQVVFKQFPGSNVFAAGEADAEGSSYRVSIWDLERGVMTMRAKSEEFTDYELRAICNLPHV